MGAPAPTPTPEQRSGTPRLPAHARVPVKEPWWNPGNQQGIKPQNPVAEARTARGIKRPLEACAAPETPAISLLAEASNMKTTKCQQEKDNTAHPLTTADEDDIATVIRMLKTWQADDNFAAKDRQSDRTAWHRVAKCDKMKNEQAQELFRSAQARLDQPGSNNDLPSHNTGIRNPDKARHKPHTSHGKQTHCAVRPERPCGLHNLANAGT